MKYIKEYNHLNNIYDEGDYVLLDIEKIIKQNQELEKKYPDEPNTFKSPDSRYAKIGFYDVEIADYPYNVIFFDDNIIYRVSPDEILRRLTPEEIKDFQNEIETMKVYKKYNL